MISLIQGKVISNNGSEVMLLTAGGVGYRIMVSPAAAKKCVVGEEVMLETYLVVREDTLDLFGFGSTAEKGLFKNFLTVGGVGPKTALHLLSLGSVEEITMAIGRGDIDYLTKVSGIGKKTAERIVVELREKVIKGRAEGDQTPVSDALGDVVDALITLGYSSPEAREAVKKLNSSGKTSEQLLREALRIIK